MEWKFLEFYCFNFLAKIWKYFLEKFISSWDFFFGQKVNVRNFFTMRNKEIQCERLEIKLETKQ